MVGISILVVSLAALITLGVIFKDRKVKKVRIDGVSRDVFNHIFNQASDGPHGSVVRNQVSKIEIMEDLDISPKDLLEHLRYLKGKGVIDYTRDHVTVTAFGIQFLKNFKDDI
jgi:hypothetical protein